MNPDNILSDDYPRIKVNATPAPNPLPCGCKEMLATITDIETATAFNWNHYSKAFMKTRLDQIHQLARAAIKAAGKETG